jgi:hypothetical protein
VVRQTIAEGAARLIAQRGPVSACELGQALVADGLTNVRQPTRAASAALNRDGVSPGFETSDG